MFFQIKSVLSDGIAIGNIKKINVNTNYLNDDSEETAFQNAITKSLAQIDKMMEDNKELDDYLVALKLMISDKTLISGVKSLIHEGYKAYDAVEKIMNMHIAELNLSTSAYLKERVADLRDIKERILNNLGNNSINELNKSYIIFVNELNPTDLIFHKKNILAIIAKHGGYTSHSAILARNWGIPYIIYDNDLEDGENVILDTFKMRLITKPTQEEIYDYKLEIAKREGFVKKAIKHDGFDFLANVGSNFDLENVCQYGFDGIGLYRTELIFMNSDKPLSFDEQYLIYNKASKMLNGKPITFRIFDIGDDKRLTYVKTHKKGVDNYVKNQELFITQIKALLKANEGNIKIMFPMIETPSEFNFLREWVINIANENNYNVPKLGMMLETKEALEHISKFKNVDFISIGTNDLTHDIYHISRDNALDLFSHYINDLTVKLKAVVEYAKENNIYLSVCGELASIPAAALKFYEIGIRNLSVSPSMIRTLNSIYTDFINNK